MSFQESRGILEMEQELSSKEDIMNRMSVEERQYNSSLKVMIEVYLQPLRDALLSMNPIISQDDIRVIFSTSETIHSFSGKLLSSISAALKSDQAPKIGAVFIEMGQFFKMYEQYASNFEAAACKVSECLKRDPSFCSFLESCQSSHQCGGMSLFSLLLLPLQRIAAYKEDLELMLMLTPDGEEDRVHLQRSFSRVSSMCTKLQDKLIRAQELEELWDLQQMTSGHFSSFLEPNRRIVIQDDLSVAGDFGEKHRHVVLFNSGLLTLGFAESVTEEEQRTKNSRHKFDFKMLHQLVGASVTLGASRVRGQFCVIFKSPEGKNYSLFFTDRSKQTQWYNELFECIKNANSGKFTAADSGNVSLGDYLLDQNDVDIGAIKTKHWDPERPRPSFKFGAGLEKLFKGFDDTLISLAQHFDGLFALRLYIFLNWLFSPEVLVVVPYALVFAGLDGLGLEMASALMITQVICAFLKRFVWRTRPYRQFSGDKAESGFRAKKIVARFGSSFPCTSVCYSVTFAYMGVYAAKYFVPSNCFFWWLPFPPLLMTPITAFSRISLGLNYPSDCLLGTLLSTMLMFATSFNYKTALFGCPACAFGGCYSWYPTKITDLGSMSTYTAMNNPHFLLIVPVVFPIAVFLLLRRPFEVYRKLHIASAFFLSTFLFSSACLCPGLGNEFQALNHPTKASILGGSIGLCIGMVASVIGYSSDRGERGAWKRQVVANIISFWVLFVPLLVFRIYYLGRPEYSPPNTRFEDWSKLRSAFDCEQG